MSIVASALDRYLAAVERLREMESEVELTIAERYPSFGHLKNWRELTHTDIKGALLGRLRRAELEDVQAIDVSDLDEVPRDLSWAMDERSAAHGEACGAWRSLSHEDQELVGRRH